MIKGFIDEYGHPLIEIEMSGRKDKLKMLALVDSGFDGELCLPIEIAVPLGLELSGIETIELADGSMKEELVFNGIIKWEEELRSVRILLTSSKDAIIGTELMFARLLSIDFRAREVRIEK